MTPTNQPTESKGERAIVDLMDGWMWDESEALITVGQVRNTDLVQIIGTLIAEAGTVYHDTGLTPRQLAERLKELEDRLCIDPGGSDAIDQAEEAISQLRAQLAASEAAREEMRASLERLYNFASLRSDPDTRWEEPMMVNARKALAQQPAEALEKREEERAELEAFRSEKAWQDRMQAEWDNMTEEQKAFSRARGQICS